MEINISGINKAAILAALYNNSRPQGLGFLHFKPDEMTIENAEKLLEQQTYFDYLLGRVMKVDLSGDILRTWLYDRDNGQGAAEAAIKHLLSKQQ